jgi:chromate reductase, NAD(P)H dehydrogenase (quinone)
VIEIISGTNRPNSQTRRVAGLIESLYHEAGVKDVRILDLQDMPPEIFNPASYGEKPASFKPLADRILQADGLHVVTPEYNGSFPGVLKYFIDMLKFPESFEHRAVAYTGVAGGVWGAFRSVEQLQMIFGYRNAYNLPERVWIAGIGRKWSEDGRTLNDELSMQLLRKQIAEFVPFVEAHRGQAAKA